MTDYLQRLEDELVRAGYDRSLRARVRRSPARPVLTAALAVAVAVAAGAGVLALTGEGRDRPIPTSPAPRTPVDVAVSPAVGGPHTHFKVTFTAPYATGDVGRTRRTYVVHAAPVTPHSACVNNRDAYPEAARAGARVSARLSPAGDGGPLGWCPGIFRGVVRYTEDFACPPSRTCRPPRGFRRHHEVVARFSFRVR